MSRASPQAHHTWSIIRGVLLKLVETKENKNFIKSHISASLPPVSKHFPVRTTATKLIINGKDVGKFFKSVKYYTFYFLPQQKSFDGIIGNNTPRDMKAVKDRRHTKL